MATVRANGETNLPGEVVKLVLSGDGQVCAALIHPQGDSTRTMLCCLGSTGQSGWEFETEAPVTGLSLARTVCRWRRAGAAECWRSTISSG